MLRRLIGPSAKSANALAQEVGVSQPLLARWLRESRNVEDMASSKKRKWTGAEKLRVVIAARGQGETELGALLRREGVLESDLTAWQAAAEVALHDAGRRARPMRSAFTSSSANCAGRMRPWPRPRRSSCRKNSLGDLGDGDDTTDPTRAR